MEKQEAKGRGRLPHRLLTLILTLTCLVSFSLPANALIISNGTASSGGEGSATTTGGGYTLPEFVNEEYINAPAYRFTIVNSTGGAQSTSIDVYKSAYWKYAGTTYHKVTTKYPKTILKTLYLTDAQLESGAVQDNCYGDDYIGKDYKTGKTLSLPKNTVEMANSWSKNPNYIGHYLQKLWGAKVEDLAKNNYYLLIEPIYPVNLAGQPHSLTVTEMAVYGANQFGASTVPPLNGNTNSWANISHYTNRYYPNALRLSYPECGLSAPTEIQSRASFGQVIREGYGAMIVSAKNATAATPPEVVSWTYSQNQRDGFSIYIEVKNADKLQVPVWTKNAGKDDLVWYEAKKASNTVDGKDYNWYLYVEFADHKNEMGTYKTDFYAYNDAGQDVDYGEFTPVSTGPQLIDYRVHQTGTGYEGFTVYLKIENADLVNQGTKHASGKGNENVAPLIAGNYTLDGVEYNYKFSATFNEFDVTDPIGEYITTLSLTNELINYTQKIKYTLGHHPDKLAVASEDGKGFYVYVDSRGTTSVHLEVEHAQLLRSYDVEEGYYPEVGRHYRFRAFVPYEDFADKEDEGISRYGTYLIRVHGGNDHTFNINPDGTTKPYPSIHNPTRNAFPPDVFEFTPESYTVTYSTLYGEAPANQTKLQYIDLELSDTVPQHPDPESDFVFAGWYNADHSKVYWPGETYTENADLALYAEWKSLPSLEPAGVGYATIWVGDVFDPMDHLDKFDFPEGYEVGAVTIRYNGVPRDSDNKATTSGTGYTVVYDIAFKNGAVMRYNLVVTVLEVDGDAEGPRGFIRFISHKFLDTLNANSKWRTGPLKTILEKTLAILNPTDEDAAEVWHFSPDDVQDVKDWINEGKEAGQSREEQNAEFGSKFGGCKTK